MIQYLLRHPCGYGVPILFNPKVSMGLQIHVNNQKHAMAINELSELFPLILFKNLIFNQNFYLNWADIYIKGIVNQLWLFINNSISSSLRPWCNDQDISLYCLIFIMFSPSVLVVDLLVDRVTAVEYFFVVWFSLENCNRLQKRNIN